MSDIQVTPQSVPSSVMKMLFESVDNFEKKNNCQLHFYEWNFEFFIFNKYSLNEKLGYKFYFSFLSKNGEARFSVPFIPKEGETVL